MLLSGGLVWTFTDHARLKQEMPDGDSELQRMVVGTLHLNTPMTGLDRDDSAVRGVRIRTGGRTTTMRAGGVLLCTGGFQGDPALVSAFVTRHVDKLYLRANPWSTGDGLRAARDRGAALTPWLGSCYGHALAAPPGRLSAAEFREITQRYGQHAVALNLDGRRFADESLGTGEEVLNQAIAAERDATAVYVVDRRTEETTQYGGELPRGAIERAQRHGARVAIADDLDALCATLGEWGIPPGIALDPKWRVLGDLSAHRVYPRCPGTRSSYCPCSSPPE